jgi:hypothetical protein
MSRAASHRSNKSVSETFEAAYDAACSSAVTAAEERLPDAGDSAVSQQLVQQQQQQAQETTQQQQQLSAEDQLVSHVLAVDAANRQALGQLYDAWHDEFSQAEQHNSAALALHRQASQQHVAKLAAYRHLYQVWQQQVQQLEAAAQEVFEQALSKAAGENARLAQLHEQEVQEKQTRERQYAQVKGRSMYVIHMWCLLCVGCDVEGDGHGWFLNCTAASSDRSSTDAGDV